MTHDKLIIAAAGAGKTTFLVTEALKIVNERVLITTYTQANEAEIRKKIIEINQCIPPNIIVQTWFSFLLQHGVRPFQGSLYEKPISGLILVNSQSGLKGTTKFGVPFYYSEEKEFDRHYFSKEGKIFSDKISKFVVRANTNSSDAVVERLCKVYPNIFVDEVQDLAGYDLELLKLLFASTANILMVGDPRQGTYSTNSSAKNKKFKKSAIVNFFEDDSISVDTDTTSLTINYRCNEIICKLSNRLFLNLPQVISGNSVGTDHDGIFLIKPSDVKAYLENFLPVQLRDNIKTKTNDAYRAMNFGESKGLSFDRVLIYPTGPILDWLKNENSELAPTSRSKFYVALTRARHSVGVVCDYKEGKGFEHLNKWPVTNNN